MRGRTADPRRRRAEQAGRRAEAIALWYLRLKLYRLVARRYRTPVGEIDLVMRRGRSLVFVEVKQRPDEAAGLDAVTAKSRARISRAAGHFVAAHPEAARLDQRFDIVVATPRRLPVHLVSAFGEGGAAW
ncbi:MAG: YraN family protein [Rhizobiales bacterium]|nr:YraN family protein [Hyphomicrobiales bacterium]